MFLYIENYAVNPNNLPELQALIADNNYTFTTLIDEATGDRQPLKAAAAFGVDGVPAWFVIDKNGRIRYKMEGYESNFEYEMRSVIELTRDLAGEKRVTVFDL